MSQQNKQRSARHRVPQQIALFAEYEHAKIVGAPTWSGLSAETQTALTVLMTQLILDHADKRRKIVTAGGSHDL